MIYSLEEMITYCEKVAEVEERNAKLHQRPDKNVKGSGKRYLSYLERAKEHRQLAEWLKELKKYREILTRLDAMIDCYENCESCQGFREYPTSQFVKDVIQINKGANADEDKTRV